jgi:hypothetical protein
MIDFQTAPEHYKHWKLSFDGDVARLSMDVQEDETMAEGYKLKLNSYDLGVDIELADAVQRTPLRTSERPCGRDLEPETAHLLRRCKHLHAGHVVTRLQSELLQISRMKRVARSRMIRADQDALHRRFERTAQASVMNGNPLRRIYLCWMTATRRFPFLRFLCSAFCRVLVV